MCYLYYFDTCNFALISYLHLLMHVLFHFVRFKDGYFVQLWVISDVLEDFIDFLKHENTEVFTITLLN
jgi:hypothetical protein